jgi:hypothetical protein
MCLRSSTMRTCGHRSSRTEWQRMQFVRYWRKADIRELLTNVRFQGKADMPIALRNVR